MNDEGSVPRTSHALAVDGRVFVIDPTEGEGIDERILALGRPAAVPSGRNRDPVAPAGAGLGVGGCLAPASRGEKLIPAGRAGQARPGPGPSPAWGWRTALPPSRRTRASPTSGSCSKARSHSSRPASASSARLLSSVRSGSTS